MITVNGKQYVGDDISVINNKVFIDGKDITPDEKTINVTIDSYVKKIDIQHCTSLIVNGDVGSVKSTSGDIDVSGDVTDGDVSTSSGDIECGSIHGNCWTSSGDIECGRILGDVSTVSGDINLPKV